MSTIPTIIGDLRDVQQDPSLMRHTTRLLKGVAKYNPEAANMVKYLGEFISMSCAPDMLSMKLFPNAKEISESFAAFDAVRYRLPQFHLGDPDVHVVAVGDGRTPRTAATFAFRTNWTCHSVDPISKGGLKRWEPIKRLHIYPTKIEDFKLEAKRVILVAVHSHARLPAAIKAIRAKELAVVSMPCCVPQNLEREPDLAYQDKGVISPHRLIKIWHNVARAE